MSFAEIDGMENVNDVQQIRRRNLALLCQRATTGPADKGIAALAELVGRPAAQISDMLYARKSFGEKIARDFEERLGLHRYALDALMTSDAIATLPLSPPDHETVAVMKMMQTMRAETRNTVVKMVQVLVAAEPVTHYGNDSEKDK